MALKSINQPTESTPKPERLETVLLSSQQLATFTEGMLLEFAALRYRSLHPAEKPLEAFAAAMAKAGFHQTAKSLAHACADETYIGIQRWFVVEGLIEMDLMHQWCLAKTQELK